MNEINFDYEKELAKCKTIQDITGKGGFVQRVVKDAMEKLLAQEFNKYMENEEQNYRNGTIAKTVKTEYGDIPINVPRDRNGNFEPELIKKRDTISDGIKSQITAMYSKGMSTRDISDHIEAMYGTSLSATTISNITDESLEYGRDWFNRGLDEIYPIVFMDAVHFKVKDENRIVSKAAYIALGVNLEGYKEILGIWIGENEGAKFWLKVCTELKNRGVKDILIACIDGLTGFPDAIQSVFPNTKIQLCIIHQIRNSIKYVNYKDQKEFMNDLKQVYKAVNAEEGLNALNKMYENWGKKYGMVLDSWLSKWENLSTFYEYENNIRKIMYTTNAIEGLNRQLRKTTKTKTVFPTNDALLKSLYLATNDITKKWTSPYQNWCQTIAQLKINFEDRIPEVV